jgi:hypothetical protein
MQARPLLLAQTLAVAQRLLLEQWRQRRGLIFWAVFPAAMMLLFGLVYAHNASMRAGLDAAAAGILMGAALFFSCLGGTVALIAAERERRTLRRLLASPLHPVAYFLGVVLAQLLLAAVQGVALAGLEQARPLPPPVSGDPARLPAGVAVRLPASLAQASAAFAASALLRQALGEELHGSLLDSQAAEVRRCAGLSEAELAAADAWWPLVGGLA